ncbi:MAG: hypothetical protein M1814_005396 [Vezdaea aestivalis]|nr:MAG: hypothetical protein M1814_005396 [Vezdaea aestivalis]
MARTLRSSSRTLSASTPPPTTKSPSNRITKPTRTPKAKKAKAAPEPSPTSPAGVPDSLAPNMYILLLGSNPGLQSSAVGHCYANPSNRFWSTLYTAGLTPRKLTCYDDQMAAREFGIGNTNVVARPTRGAAEVAKEEIRLGWLEVDKKVAEWKPEVLGVVGKGIWESRPKGMGGVGKGVKYGWQEGVRIGAEDGWEGARVFVTSSTSGLAAGLTVEEKAEVWRPLGEWTAKRRKEREQEAEVGERKRALDDEAA